MVVPRYAARAAPCRVALLLPTSLANSPSSDDPVAASVIIARRVDSPAGAYLIELRGRLALGALGDEAQLDRALELGCDRVGIPAEPRQRDVTAAGVEQLDHFAHLACAFGCRFA